MGDGRSNEKDVPKVILWVLSGLFGVGISGMKFYTEGRLLQPVPKILYREREMTDLPLAGIKVCVCDVIWFNLL